MQYRVLGTTGIKVSELCLGAMTFGRETTEAESFAILDAFAAAGGNFIDTADVYSRGVSEEILGRWLARQRREDFVIATKVRYPMGEGPNETGLSRKHIMDGIAGSLRRLQTDYVDLYQIHGWDPLTPITEILRTLNDLVRRGLVRHIGASNVKGWQLQQALEISRTRNWESFVSLQPQYNLLCRATEWELLDVCRREQVGVIPWSPLRGGWLSGKFRRGMTAPPGDSRIAVAEEHGWGERWSNYDNEYTWGVLDVLHAVAEECRRTPAQVAINWLLRNDGVTAPIIGARTLDQLQANLGAGGWELSSPQMETLNRASALPVSYPYDRDAEWQRERE
ncbi:MAG: aldo/keto reductase [Spirochaetaceae bacterium]|nr:MAG: aldo/keto reductase [Spirochaetaceae bacterium]